MTGCHSLASDATGMRDRRSHGVSRHPRALQNPAMRIPCPARHAATQPAECLPVLHSMQHCRLSARWRAYAAACAP